ncbi:MAG: hypothetical protein IJU41_02615, partial [Clostridia bacterium]|nr:hypothetical protein [Clostridia bacterium]
SSATKITAGVTGGSEAGRAYIEADLAPGLYYYKVYYNGSSDYIIKRFFLDGRSETATYDCPFEPFVENAYMEKTVSVTTDQILENFYGTDDLVGYKTPDTPTFTLHADDRRFMSNGELCAYTEALAENCAYLHLFILDLETETNRMPVLLFTKDEIPEGATLEEAAEIVRGGGVREIMMISGGKHGNEPAGEEGVLDFAADLAGDYGNGVLDAFGAIVVIPATSVDNLQRFTRTYPDGVNPNRDMISLSHEDCRKEAYIYTLFMPTVRVDCHEDTSGTVSVEADYSQSNLADVCFQYNGVPNAPLTDAYGIADGTAPLLSQGRRSVLDRLISRVDALGLRGAHYQWPYYTPGMSDAYGAVRGSYGFLIEVMRILSGKSHYARAVFAMKEGLKALTAEIIATNGEMASEVAAARAAAAVTAFDEHNIFVTGMSLGGSGLCNVGKYPSAYVDGTYKDADNLRSYSRYDTVTASRPMPTAYVLPADAEQIGAILSKLDEHGLTYEKIKAGSKLTLKRYTLGSSVSYGAAQEVTFDAGAYVFLTDTSDAYLMAYLFEPDSYVSSDTAATSLYQAGLIADGDALYRSETDGMRLLIEDMLEKTVAGDVNGDGVVGLADALHALRAMLSGQPLSAADLDGNGVITLVDILKILKVCAA